jgi:hypothetical protein
MTPAKLMERFPQMDLMMAETILHAEKTGLLDKIELVRSSNESNEEIVVTNGIVIEGPVATRSGHSTEKSNAKLQTQGADNRQN